MVKKKKKNINNHNSLSIWMNFLKIVKVPMFEEFSLEKNWNKIKNDDKIKKYLSKCEAMQGMAV